jgi:hypothetical protein
LLDPDCDDSVDTIRTLIFQGHNDPLNLDFRGDNFITGYIGNAEGYLWVLCQEEFEVDILNAGDRPLHVIARSLAFQLDNDITCSPSRSWEPALRRLIKLGVPPISTGLGTKVTPLDTLLTSIESQVSSGPIAREWLTLLSSVGVDIEEYISVERGTHTNGFVFPDYPGPELLQIVPRQIIFEERGNRKQLNIEWKWFYDHQSPAHLALTEFSTFGNLLSGESSVWELTWPFIHIEAHKNLYLCRSVEDYKRMLSKLKILEARWTRQAARRQRRSEFIARFIKPSRSERQRRVPGSWVEDHVSVSASWQVTRVSRISGRLFLFTLGVIYFSWRLKVRGLETAAEKELSIVLQSLFLLSVSLYLFVRKGRSYC